MPQHWSDLAIAPVHGGCGWAGPCSIHPAPCGRRSADGRLHPDAKPSIGRPSPV